MFVGVGHDNIAIFQEAMLRGGDFIAKDGCELPITRDRGQTKT